MKLLMKRWQNILLAGGLLLAAVSGAHAAGDAAAGEQKAYTCLGCHGVLHYVNTYPTYHVPRLGGQHETYLVAALQAYRSKTRSHETMQANAASLSDQDIADIAAYFASEPKELGSASSVEAPAQVATCSACHAQDGNSTIATNPRLAGQYETYLVQALKEYRSGERENAIMAGFAAGLTDDDIASLAEYFASQPGTLQTLDQ